MIGKDEFGLSSVKNKNVKNVLEAKDANGREINSDGKVFESLSKPNAEAVNEDEFPPLPNLKPVRATSSGAGESPLKPLWSKVIKDPHLRLIKYVLITSQDQ